MQMNWVGARTAGRRHVLLLVAVLLALGCSLPLLAQGGRGTINGTITDDAGV